ncbi:hypothetical protein GCM10018952_22450 [Streptosporangium vulgare]
MLVAVDAGALVGVGGNTTTNVVGVDASVNDGKPGLLTHVEARMREARLAESRWKCVGVDVWGLYAPNAQQGGARRPSPSLAASEGLLFGSRTAHDPDRSG